jgi:tryptophan-rich sensory protein
MPSLLLFLLLTVLAAGVASWPVAGSWFYGLQGKGWMFSPLLLISAWSLVYLAQGVAGWQSWRTARRHATPLLVLWVWQFTLWALWAYSLLAWHRPGWALGVVSLSGLVQLLMMWCARSQGAAVIGALLPGLLWLAALWAFSVNWWLAHGGGLRINLA